MEQRLILGFPFLPCLFYFPVFLNKYLKYSPNLHDFISSILCILLQSLYKPLFLFFLIFPQMQIPYILFIFYRSVGILFLFLKNNFLNRLKQHLVWIILSNKN